MHQPNNIKEERSEQARLGRFQLCDDAYVQWSHFVDGYEDKICDVWCQCYWKRFERKYFILFCKKIYVLQYVEK